MIFISPCVLSLFEKKKIRHYEDDMMDARWKNCHIVEYTQNPNIENEIVLLI